MNRRGLTATNLVRASLTLGCAPTALEFGRRMMCRFVKSSGADAPRSPGTNPPQRLIGVIQGLDRPASMAIPYRDWIGQRGMNKRGRVT